MSYEKTINDFHDSLFARHRGGDGSLGWRSRDSQQARFDAVLSQGPLDGMSVLDVGCGFGDLAPALKARAPSARYTGWDINPQFVEVCRANAPDLVFERRNILVDPPETPFDVILSVGPINIELGSNEELMRRMLKAMYKSCTSHCVMSMASRETRGGGRDFHYYDPCKMLDFCFSLTKNVILRHDYHPSDFCVFLFH
ncbi:class I SAM-dependent methyltransferase [Phaeospirillum tilakii]|uniref:Class I SAM-dependent methyltransferase n=1 Tax=Phaeospirillum tilakii TaxID=741673 RepID=A0ABW5C580_9PROT